jgi:hypothetical protein
LTAYSAAEAEVRDGFQDVIEKNLPYKEKRAMAAGFAVVAGGNLFGR